MSRRDPMGLGYDPDILRALCGAYERILRTLEELRAEPGQSLEGLLSVATVHDEVETKLRACSRRLERVEVLRYQQARNAAEVQP